MREWLDDYAAQVVSIFIGFVLAVLLRLFYATISSEWPRHYFSAKTTIEDNSRSNLFRYMALRLFPVYIFAVLAATLAGRQDASEALAVAVLVAVHLSTSTFRAIWKLWNYDRRGATPLTILYHALSTIGVLGAGFLAVVTAPDLDRFVPEGVDAVNAVWTAALAAILGAGLRQAMAREELEPVDRISKARADIGDQVWAHCDSAAAENGTDPDLLRAIIATEALQRPRWMRRLENLFGRVLGPGTYGVAQMHSLRPIDDIQSVNLLALSLRDVRPGVDEDGQPYQERTMAILERHNGSDVFIGCALEIYTDLLPYPLERTPRRAEDGRGIIEVTRIARDGQVFSISGTASVHEGNLQAVVDGNPASSITVHPSAPGRGKFFLSVPLSTKHVDLLQPDESEGEGPPQSEFMAHLDLTER
jgi:hypothetical protein